MSGILFFNFASSELLKETIMQTLLESYAETSFVVGFDFNLNPKRAGLFGPISQPGGQTDSAPPKILETD